MGSSPAYRFGCVTLGLAIGLAYLALRLFRPLGPVGAWLLAINLVALLVYGYDKAIAGSGQMRVPERVLLVLALAGGTAGALAGMWVFRHKTAKKSFRLRMGLVIAAQIVLVGVYYLWIRPLVEQ